MKQRCWPSIPDLLSRGDDFSQAIVKTFYGSTNAVHVSKELILGNDDDAITHADGSHCLAAQELQISVFELDWLSFQVKLHRRGFLFLVGCLNNPGLAVVLQFFVVHFHQIIDLHSHFFLFCHHHPLKNQGAALPLRRHPYSY